MVKKDSGKAGEASSGETAKPTAAPPPPPPTYAARLIDAVKVLSGNTKDERDVNRIIRRLGLLRAMCDPKILISVANSLRQFTPILTLMDQAAALPYWTEKRLAEQAVSPQPMDIEPEAPGDKAGGGMDEGEKSGTTVEKSGTAADKSASGASGGESAAAEKGGEGAPKKADEPAGPKRLSPEAELELLVDLVKKGAEEPLVVKFLAMVTTFFFIDSLVKTAEVVGKKKAFAEVLPLLKGGGMGALEICRSYMRDSTQSNDLIDSKVYFAAARVYTLCDADHALRRWLLQAYRTATLERKPLSQATIINQLLQSYLAHGEADLAIKFIQRTSFPEHIRSTPQIVRCYFNLGRIQSIRLEYSDAHDKILTAIRKLPNNSTADPKMPNSKFGNGFKLLAYKHAICVELLMGDIPEVSIFQSSEFGSKLRAYEELVLAVRSGDLLSFESVCSRYREQQFAKDGTLFLIERLRYSVIKIGLRRINLTYSRITLADIAQKLGVKSVQEAESVLTKGIIDGVVSGQIDGDVLISKIHEKENEPTTAQTAAGPYYNAYDKRIRFCLNMHKDAVKAIQYPEETSLKVRAMEAERRRQALMQEEVERAAEEGYDDDDDFI